MEGLRYRIFIFTNGIARLYITQSVAAVATTALKIALKLEGCERVLVLKPNSCASYNYLSTKIIPNVIFVVVSNSVKL